MLYIKERKTIISACIKLLDSGHILGTYGNMSIRRGNHILFTPSGADYTLMSPEDIVISDLSGTILEGSCPVTSEKELHLKIYSKRPDIHSVIHTHSENALTLSASDIDEVPCLSEEMAQVLGGSVPLTESYVQGKDHKKLALYAVSAMGSRSSVILRNHGLVSCGRTPEEAFLSCQIAEKSCSMYLSLLKAGLKISSLPDDSIRSEHHRYLYVYGK